MLKNKDLFIIYILTAFALFVFMVLLCGCSLLPTSGGGNPSQSAPETLYKTVHKISWLPMLSILGVAGGVFALMNGFRWGIPAIVSCLVALFMSLATARYSGFMAICGLVGSILIVVASVLIKHKALVEIVTGVEKLKIESANSKAVCTALSGTQTKHTENIVKRVRARINGG